MAGIIFDNVDLRSTYNFIVQDIGGRGSPPVVSQDLDMPELDGALLLNRKVGTRKLTIRAIVYGKTSAEAKEKKDSLIRLLSTAYDQDKKILFPDTERYLWVRLGSEPVSVGPMGAVFNSIAYDLTINFEAREPYFFGEEFEADGLIVGGIQNVSVDAISFVGSPKTRYLPNEPYLVVQQISPGNLLGNCGDFEIDSNGDGLADGWEAIGDIVTTLSTSSVTGNYSQHIQTIGTSRITKNITVSENDVIFVSAYLKGTEVRLKATNSVGNTTYELLNISESSLPEFTKKSGIFTSTGTTVTLHTYAPSGADFYIDSLQFIVLNKLPSLPSWVQSHYGVQKWEDMSVDDLSNFFDYHDGFDIDNTLVIENRRGNLISMENFPSSQVLYSYASNGSYWQAGTGRWYNNGLEMHHNQSPLITDGYVNLSEPIHVKPNTDYTFSFIQKILGNRGHFSVLIRNAVTGDYLHVSSAYLNRYLSGLCKWAFNTENNTSIQIRIDAYNSHGFYSEFQLVEGELSKEKTPSHKNKIVISTLHSYSVVSDEVDFKRGKITRYWSFWETYTTDSNGNISVPKYKPKTISNIQRVSDAAIKDISSSSTTLNTGWTNTEIKIRYQLSEVNIESIDFNGEINLYPGQNNIIAPRNALLKIMGNRKYMEG